MTILEQIADAVASTLEVRETVYADGRATMIVTSGVRVYSVELTTTELTAASERGPADGDSR